MELKFSYDEFSDTLVIEDIAFSGELFRLWAKGGLPLYEPFVITERKNQAVSIERIPRLDEILNVLHLAKHEHYSEPEGLVSCPAGYQTSPGVCDCGANEINAEIDALVLKLRAAQPCNAGDVVPMGESGTSSGDLAQRA